MGLKARIPILRFRQFRYGVRGNKLENVFVSKLTSKEHVQKRKNCIRLRVKEAEDIRIDYIA